MGDRCKSFAPTTISKCVTTVFLVLLFLVLRRRSTTVLTISLLGKQYNKIGDGLWIIWLSGSGDYLGKPKEATVLIFLLDENGMYQMTAYRGRDRLVPELSQN